MKQRIRTLIEDSVKRFSASNDVALDNLPAIQIEVPKNSAHGDYSTNIAMLMAKFAGRAPRAIAEELLADLSQHALLERCEIAGPGFINFFVAREALLEIMGTVLQLGDTYGCSEIGGGEKVLLEFVSANPTGPLHIGHGRHAAYGAALANLLRATGHAVTCEYYVNDAGRQMDILALSVWLRYRERVGAQVDFPVNGYQGDYIVDIAQALRAVDNAAYDIDGGLVDVPAADQGNVDSHDRGGDLEAILDRRIAACQKVLGNERYRRLHVFATQQILSGIKTDLGLFGVNYEGWYSERDLVDRGEVQTALGVLASAGWMYEQAGATWFRSQQFGDEKDRVVVRENTSSTYFASDIAYHHDKFARGFERVINIWGADHHGYIPRVEAAVTALGHDPTKLEVLLVQFASLYRAGEKVQMSTRSGSFVTLRELIEEVGKDAARFFYVMRRSDQHLDFDLDLAKAQTSDNPVYYIQYAHARICSIFRQFAEQGGEVDREQGLDCLSRLVEEHERALAIQLIGYVDLVAQATRDREPHQVANYLRSLATLFHVYYNTHKILVEETELRQARLALCAAIKQVLANGSALLGISCPTEM